MRELLSTVTQRGQVTIPAEVRKLLGVPVSVVIFMVVAIVVGFVLHYHRYGRAEGLATAVGLAMGRLDIMLPKGRSLRPRAWRLSSNDRLARPASKFTGPSRIAHGSACGRFVYAVAVGVGHRPQAGSELHARMTVEDGWFRSMQPDQ